MTECRMAQCPNGGRPPVLPAPPPHSVIRTFGFDSSFVIRISDFSPRLPAASTSVRHVQPRRLPMLLARPIPAIWVYSTGEMLNAPRAGGYGGFLDDAQQARLE